MSNQKTTRRNQRHRRVRGQISGSADKPRLSVYRSNRHMYAQLIDDDAGETIAAASSLEMDTEGSLKDKAEAVGTAVAERGQAEGVEEIIFDRGGYDYGGRVKALADAARDEGLDF